MNRNKKIVKDQPRKDSKDPRVNYDNTRADKFRKDMRVKGMQADPKDFNEVKCNGKENDIAWYNKVADLYNPATNVSIQPVTGLPINEVQGLSVPGCYATYWAPSLGVPDLQAINQIKESLYSFVVHANSRNTSYDANDLFMTFVGGGQVFCYLATLLRAYGCMSNFNATNKNTPQELVTAMGFDYNDFAKNYPNMLFDLNRMIVASRQIWVPSHFTFVTRWFWMNSNIYKDANSSKAQFYMHVQNYYWMYSETASDNGTCLLPVSYQGSTPIDPDSYVGSGYNVSDSLKHLAVVPASGTLCTWKSAVEFFWKLLDPLVNSTYRGVMMGDILKAYGPNDLFSVATIDANYSVVPVYSAEVLMQIENATINRHYPNIGIFQNQDHNVIQPVAMYRTEDIKQMGNFVSQPVLNFHTLQEPSKDDLMIATRLKVAGYTTMSSVNKVMHYITSYVQFDESLEPYTISTNTLIKTPKSSGSEVIVDAYMFRIVYDSETRYTYTGGIKVNDNLVIETTQCFGAFTGFTVSSDGKVIAPMSTYPSSIMMMLNQWSAYDWAPWVYLIPSTNGADGVPNGKWEQAFGDWDYWGTIPDENLTNMHTAALYSQLNVPFMG